MQVFSRPFGFAADSIQQLNDAQFSELCQSKLSRVKAREFMRLASLTWDHSTLWTKHCARLRAWLQSAQESGLIVCCQSQYELRGYKLQS